ncbi:MAG: helix-turn-helix domain-containing protein [Candidatus Omnitrophica bacterium]|nr:helix-turn-helix domain-containing protein [Candidatus Omnitrophota bacterium]
MANGIKKISVNDIGKKIKKVREERKLSMRELAAMSGVSVSFISKVEMGKVSPTVMSLQKLLDAMNIDLHEFFLNRHEEDISGSILFKKRDMGVSKDKERKWYYAFPRHPNIKMELTYEEYRPHTTILEKEYHKGDLCGLVISGELTLKVIDEGVFKIRQGDAFYVRAGKVHVATNSGGRVLKLVAVQQV